MSVTGRPYSDAALQVAERARQQDDSTAEMMDAAHDRSALGLEASVHAASYRREVIEEVAAWLRTEAIAANTAEAYRAADVLSAIAEDLLREFGATDDQ